MDYHSLELAQNQRGQVMVSILGAIMIFVYLSAVSRVWARRMKGRSLALNDWAIIIATFTITLLYSMIFVGVAAGRIGYHMRDVINHPNSPEMLRTGAKAVFVGDLAWYTSSGLVKFSILHLYMEVFGQTRTFRWQVYFLMGLCACFVFGNYLNVLLVCRPVEFNWDKSVHGTCADTWLAYLIPAILNSTLDILIFILPMPVLWRLKMPLRSKLATSAVFSFGLGICCITLLRIKYLRDFRQEDATYHMWVIFLLGPLEPTLGVISASLPMMSLAISRITNGRLFSSHENSLGTGTHSSKRDRFFDTKSRLRSTSSKAIVKVRPDNASDTYDHHLRSYTIGGTSWFIGRNGDESGSDHELADRLSESTSKDDKEVPEDSLSTSMSTEARRGITITTDLRVESVVKPFDGLSKV